MHAIVQTNQQSRATQQRHARRETVDEAMMWRIEPQQTSQSSARATRGILEAQARSRDSADVISLLPADGLTCEASLASVSCFRFSLRGGEEAAATRGSRLRTGKQTFAVRRLARPPQNTPHPPIPSPSIKRALASLFSGFLRYCVSHFQATAYYFHFLAEVGCHGGIFFIIHSFHSTVI